MKHRGVFVFLTLVSVVNVMSQTQLDADGRIEWKASGFDASGNFMGGSEIMNIVPYKGRLYAGNGFFQDGSVNYNAPYYKGAHIMVKETAASPWKVDHSFGRDFVRIESLNVFQITVGLNRTRDVLVASPSDWSTTSSTRTARVYVLDDVGNAGWVESTIKSFSSSEPGVGARSAIVYKDKVTGQEHLFVGISTGVQGGLIFKGTLKDVQPMRFQFDDAPELTDLGRPSSFAECNGDLYALSGLKKDSNTGEITGGLYRRIDGPSPSWQLVYQWPWNNSSPIVAADEKNLARGLTSVRSVTRNGEALILGRAADGVVERIEPSEQHKVYTEIDLRSYFRKYWGLTSYGPLNPCVIAHNRFHKMTFGTKRYLLFDVWVEHPDYKSRATNESFVMVRDEQGNYKGHISFYDPAHSVKPGERWGGSRTISVSPFAEDNVLHPTIYVGGHDAVVTADSTAWIYKIQLTDALFAPTTSVDDEVRDTSIFFVHPNPVASGGTGVSYSSAASGSVDLRLVDAQGRVVRQWQFEAASGSNTWNIATDGLPTGAYLLQADSGRYERPKQVVLIRVN